MIHKSSAFLKMIAKWSRSPSFCFKLAIRSLVFFKKNGQPRPLFCLFSFFTNTNLTEKTVGVRRIRTQIVGVEGKHADHLTTTTAQPRLFNTVLLQLVVSKVWLDLNHRSLVMEETVLPTTPQPLSNGLISFYLVPWWRSSGQSPRLLLGLSKFETLWSLLKTSKIGKKRLGLAYFHFGISHYEIDPLMDKA